MNSEHHVRAANKGCRRLRRLVNRVRKENAGLHKWHETLDLEHAIILVARQSPATLGVFVSRIIRQSKQRERELLRACDYRDEQIEKLTHDNESSHCDNGFGDDDGKCDNCGRCG